MRVLVTGGTGFVGSNLVRRLIEDGHDVSLLVRESRDAWRLADVQSGIRWVIADLQDPDAVKAALAAVKPQWIFHLAAHGAYSWQTDARAILLTNVIATANLLDASLSVGFDAFINTGSSSEYGLKDHAPREDEALEPNSVYAVGKAAASWYCTQVARASGAHVATLRLYSVYGPWEEPRRFISQLVARGLEGRLPPLANPDTARDYVYVDDVCSAFLAVALGAPSPGAVYNVGTGVQTTLRQAVELGRRVFDIAQQPRWGSMADRSWDSLTWVADSTRLRELLGWRPKAGLEEGLRLTADWLRSHPELEEPYRAASS